MNALRLILALAMPLLSGWWLAGVFWTTAPTRQPWTALLRFCCAVAIAWALSGADYMIWRPTFPAGMAGFYLSECLVIPLLAGWLWRRSRSRSAPPPSAPAPDPTGPARKWSIGLLVAFTACASAALVVIAAGRAWGEPAGYWDAWSIWNCKARFLFRGADNWTGFATRLNWHTHPDYPLLLPASIARLWAWLGHETALVPQLTTVNATALVILTLFAALALFRSVLCACLGLLVMVSSAWLQWYSGSQLADIPVSAFILLAFVALTQGSRTASPRLHLLAGLLAGGAAMIKNEGVALCACLLAGSWLAGWWTHDTFRRRTLWILCGMAPPLLLVAIQKATLSGESYVFDDHASFSEVVRGLFSLQRHRIMLLSLHRDFFSFERTRLFWGVSLPAPTRPSLLLLPALLLATGFRRDRRDRLLIRTAGLTLLLGFMAYYLVFLIMPHDYDLATLMESFPRVTLHTWPALVFTVFMATRLE